MTRGPLLPVAATEDQYDAIAADDELLRPGVDALCARLGLGGLDRVRFRSGSLPVYALGDRRVLKLYPHVYAEEAALEGAVLAAVDGALSIATPVPEVVGEFDGWGYLLMSRIPGVALTAPWRTLGPANRMALAERIGVALAELHAVRGPILDDLGPADWASFLDEQRADCLDRQLDAGLPPAWAEQITPFLDAVRLPDSPADTLLHCEVMGEHLLVSESADGWTLSGLIDFEPAMRGVAEYDFAAVGMFVTGGDSGALRVLLSAYGYPAHALDEQTSRRLLAYALLHCSGTLPWYLRRLPPPAEPTLDAAARAWWGLADSGPKGRAGRLAASA